MFVRICVYLYVCMCVRTYTYAQFVSVYFSASCLSLPLLPSLSLPVSLSPSVILYACTDECMHVDVRVFTYAGVRHVGMKDSV